jgi:hypothetical protein
MRERWGIVIMDRGRADGWEARFLAELAEHQVTLEGEDLLLDGVFVGSAHFEPLSAATGALATWIGAGARPHLGAPAGLFLWGHYAADGRQERELVDAIAHAARGAVERRDSHELRELVVRQRFALSELLSEYGLEEGRVLLERDDASPYITAAVAELRRVLDEHKIDEWGGFDEASHSRLRIFPVGPLSHETQLALDLTRFELWAFDHALASGKDNFWTDANY